MSKWSVGVLAISLLAVSIGVALFLQHPRPRDPNADESSRFDLQPGMGRAAGIVVDSGDFLPEGATPQTYVGASIVIRRAGCTSSEPSTKSLATQRSCWSISKRGPL